MDYQALKAKHREERDAYPQSLSLRIHRALSWLDRAEQEPDDDDAHFIFLWIAFNAAYANELDHRQRFSEHGLFAEFINKLVGLDYGNLLHELLWQEFPGPIRLIIDNKYVFQPFWEFHNGKLEEGDWQEKFQKQKVAAHTAFGNGNTAVTLSIVLGRLYTLRNQLIHGGATWNGRVNREQVRDAAAIMGRVVPVVILIMMNHPNELWGDACYPVVK